MISNKQYDVFLSYKREDKEIMAKVRDALRADGIIVWTDESIAVADDHRTYSAAIDKALNDSKSVILLASKASQGSEYVLGEIETAKSLGLPIFPVIIKDTPNEALPLEYRRAQYFDAREAKLESSTIELIERVVARLKLVSISKLQHQIEQLTAERDALQNRYNEFRKNGRQVEAELKLKISELEQDLSEETAQLERVRADLEMMRRSERNQGGQLQYTALPKSVQPSLENYNRQVVELQQKYEQERFMVTALQSQVSKLEEQLNVQPPIQKIPTQILDEKYPKHLNAANPTDWLRLMWWVLVTPEVFKAHQSSYGNKAHQHTANWLDNTLSWIPLFLTMLATTLNPSLILNPSQFSTITPLGWCSLILFIWGLTGFLGLIDSNVAGFIETSLAALVAGGLIFVIVTGVAFGVLGLVMFFVAMMVSTIIEARIKSEESIPIALIALVLAYAFLIWVYFLGGATVLGYVKA